MLIAVACFVGILGLFIAIYWAAIVRPEDAENRELQRRLHLGGTTVAPKRVSLLNRVAPLSTVPVLEKLLRRSSAAIGPIQRLIELSGRRLTVGQFVLITVFAATVAFFAALQLTAHPGIALGAGLLCATLPYAVVRFLGRQRIAKFEEQFPEAIELMSRALRAGHALSPALGMVAEEVPEPVRSEFKLLHDRQNYGMPFPDAMKSFADRVPLLDARFFVTAVLTQREAGGNLAEVLDNLAGLTRERFKLKRHVRTLSAHGRFTGWVLGGLPFVIGGALYVIAPAHISTLFTDPIGLRIVAVSLLLQAIGILIIRRIVNIEI